MRSRGDSSLRIVSEEQAHALGTAALGYGAETDRPHRAERLPTRVSAILAADVVLLTHSAGHWAVVAAAPTEHPMGSSGALASFDELTPGIAAVRSIGGQDWTLVTSGRDPSVVALAIAGDWSLSPAPFFHLAAVVSEMSARPRGDAPVIPPVVVRLHYRMLHRLARVSGLLAVSDTIVRHAAAAVEARLGALAVTQAGDPGQAAIVATFGYPKALVEHVRIEPGAGVIGTVLGSRKPLYTTTGDRLVGARRPRYHTSSFVAVPILGDRDVLGALCVTDRRGDQAFARRDVAALRLFASGAVPAPERERALDSAEAYAHAATVDPVTGVFNRRYFQVRL